jgi:hypothetical protein
MKQALENSWFSLIICLFVMGIVGSVLSELSLRPGFTPLLSRTSVFALLAVWFVVWGSYFAWFYYSKSKCGGVMLDCGFHPLRMHFLGSSIFIFVWFIFFLNPNKSILVTGVYGLTLSLLFLHLSMGRLQITDKGIWCYWHLVKWESAISWEWGDESHQKILLHTNSKIPFCNLEAVYVEEELREQVATRISENVKPQSFP